MDPEIIEGRLVHLIPISTDTPTSIVKIDGSFLIVNNDPKLHDPRMLLVGQELQGYRGVHQRMVDIHHTEHEVASIHTYNWLIEVAYDKQHEGLRDLLRQREFSGSTPYATSSIVEDGMVIHDRWTPFERGKPIDCFTFGTIGEHPDHEAALMALVGTGDVDRVARAWRWVKGTDAYMGSLEMRGEWPYTVVIGANYREGVTGMHIEDCLNTAISARDIRVLRR